MTQTAPQDVLYPETAAPNSDVEEIQSRVEQDTKRFLSADSIGEVVQIPEDIVRYYVRYRDYPESRQFFAKVRPWLIHLCVGHPEIPTPPSEADPLAWMKWFADVKIAILGRDNAAPFTDTESNILEALGDDHLTGPVLLKKAGYTNSSHYRTVLSQLVKRLVLGNDHTGYFRLKP